MTPCPTDDELRQLLGGQLPADTSGPLARHTDQCPDCQRRLERLLDDPAESRWRALLGQAGGEAVTKLAPDAESFDTARAVACAPYAAGGRRADPGLRPGEALLRRLRADPAQTATVPASTLRLRCPHCGEPAPLSSPPPREVRCEGCRGTFLVEARGGYGAAGLPIRVGRFEVLALLGQGGFGSVYKARDPELDRVVAIKVPRPGAFGSSGDAERFLREARSAARLRHPGIVPVHEIGHERGLPYIVADFIDGTTLNDHMAHGPLGFRESALLVAQLAEALDFAHRHQVIHRDIKPGNVLLDRTGRPHLTDFGLARRNDEREITLTMDGQIVGTPAYMAPEQAAGDLARVDSRSDVYSLGVVLYELLTGGLPFRGTMRMLLHQVQHEEPRPPRRLNDRIPRDLETVCLKAMAKDPRRRYPSAGALAEDLRRFLKGEAVQARPVGRAERLWRQSWGSC